jgi:hypothetical protein
VVQLWQQWRPTGFAGAGHLPFGGGTAEQPAKIMVAFAHCLKVAGWAKPARNSDDG